MKWNFKGKLSEFKHTLEIAMAIYGNISIKDLIEIQTKGGR